jgi:glycine/D-amino acid oxidase-like deaminating enzyme/nitrite reductase/ring-hydroxylating ferredoxin subunit
MTVNNASSPYWFSTASFPQFARLDRDITVDVAIVGGGITGLTAAYLLARAGRRVAVLERDRCAVVDTGHTSAHVTMVTDARISELAGRLGKTHAQAVWDAGLAAIGQIDEIVRANALDADFAWVEGYLHAPVDHHDASAAAGLRDDQRLANDMGFDAEWIETVPIVGRPGIRFDGQARLHPRKYLAGLATAVVAAGGRIFEHTEAEEFTDAPRTVKTKGGTVRCADVIIATHNPQVGVGGMTRATLLQTKLALYTTYVVAGRVPVGTVPDALWWDTADPYHYLRLEPQGDHDVVIFGGEDHKTGQTSDTESCHRRLEAYLQAQVPGVQLTHRWSGQVIETPDGLPYVGATADHEYAATGFAGNGLTFGTLAAMMIADAIAEKTNPWADLFDIDRKALGRSLWDYVKENADYPYYMIRERFAGAETKSLRDVRRGQGRILDRNGQKVAAYRDVDGAVTLRSAVCTHMGCTIAWNQAERTWDCPCHGSRFRTDGTVIAGPAGAPLAEVE